jgi:ribosomal protein L40E
MSMSSEIGAKTEIRHSTASARKQGSSVCLNCGAQLAYCGRPFTADIECLKCGAINVFKESQQPSSFVMRKTH